MSLRFWLIPMLDTPPACFTAEEQTAVESAPSATAVARQYDALIRCHGPYPFFLVQLGIHHRFMNTQATSVALYRQAQAELAKMGIHDLQFDSWIEARQAELDKNVRIALERSKTDPYYQMWKPTKEHRFPLQAPIPPSGHDQVKEEWKQIFAERLFLFTKTTEGENSLPRWICILPFSDPASEERTASSRISRPPCPSADRDPSELQHTGAWQKPQEYSQLKILLLNAKFTGTTAAAGGLGVIVAILALLRVVVNKVD
ncbi:uncharacterized protein ARMOST_05931 [Armillaria ostoyae]|uniref:Uncharacterized protein n=1 Tax=Armillaria ostoyae TaxID=47428 RepID=A0A284R1L1_ARMOS|nr:uncharacterized protein ARMOST_05931 [Armillaria ostoyae]